MADITQDIEDFLAERQAFARRARQMAAFRLATGMDLSAALAASGAERANCIARLIRIIERERLRGATRHWSYDLNRHIALKQVLDELRGRPHPATSRHIVGARQTDGGATRRRHVKSLDRPCQNRGSCRKAEPKPRPHPGPKPLSGEN